MIICGIKLTHDGGIAVVDDNVLKFSIETEKISNNPRYSELECLDQVEELLNKHGYSTDDIDHFVVDGWHGDGIFDTGRSFLSTKSSGKELKIEVAPYNEGSLEGDILERKVFKRSLPIGKGLHDYSSFPHIAGHLLGTYCSSPFAERGESSYILCWDGGQYPRLYHLDANTRKVSNLGHLFFFLGTIYSIFGQYFGPYKKSAGQLADQQKKKDLEGFFGGYSAAGKIMAYIAKGKVRPELFHVFRDIHHRCFQVSDEFEHVFAAEVKRVLREQYPDEDVLATFHLYLETLLTTTLENKFSSLSYGTTNLCITGGCALNIKWNSAIRNLGLFDEVWVPPFPNDSGSALGAVCCEQFFQTGSFALEWSVFAGPDIIVNDPEPGWATRQCSIEELAFFLDNTNKPVVFLQGRAELGPRALGNRSIVAAAKDHAMKDLLNVVKKRELFRPVAPICMEELAPGVFTPGYSDQYMLFEHYVREEWVNRIPAVIHLDGTARLQTVSASSNPTLYKLLSAYNQLSGIPVLCNTSANLNGRGFFPDVNSATKWGMLDHVWCNSVLYYRNTQ